MPNLESPSTCVPGRHKLPGYLGEMPLLYPLWLEVHTGPGKLLIVACAPCGLHWPSDIVTETCAQKWLQTFKESPLLPRVDIALNTQQGPANVTLGVTKSPGGSMSLHGELKLASRVTDLAEDMATFHQSKY